MNLVESVLHHAVVMRRRYRLFLFVFVLAAAGVVTGAYVRRPHYESNAALLVKLDLRSVSVSRSDVQQNIIQMQAEEAVASQVELLQTRDLIEQLVDTLPAGLFEESPPKNPIVRAAKDTIDAVRRWVLDGLVAFRLIEKTTPRYRRIYELQKGLDVFPIRKAQVIHVSFRSKNPSVPPVVVGTLIDLYLKRVSEFSARSGGYRLYMDQSSRLSEDLEEAERALAQFRERHEIADLDAEKRQLLDKVDRLVATFDGAAAAASRRSPPAANTPDGAFGEPPTPGIGVAIVPTQVLQLTADLTDLRIERARQIASFSPNNPKVRELDKQIAEVESLLDEEIAQLERVLDGYQSRLATLLRIEPEYNKMERRVRILTDAYETYRKAAEDRRVTFKDDSAVNVQLVDSPSFPYRPLPPNRLTLILAGLILALFLASAAVFLVEWVQASRPARTSTPAPPKAVAS